jgi:hypothetical protein
VAGDHGGPPPDDSRLAEIAEAIARVRGHSKWKLWQVGDPFVVWSGPLPPGSDVHDQVETLMREPWGLFSGTAVLDEPVPQPDRVPRLEEISEDAAIHWLTWLLGHDLAYEDPEHLPVAETGEIARAFVELLPLARRWFTNLVQLGDREIREPRGLKSWNPLTPYTFDSGVIAAGEGRAYIVWLTGED